MDCLYGYSTSDKYTLVFKLQITLSTIAKYKQTNQSYIGVNHTHNKSAHTTMG